MCRFGKWKHLSSLPASLQNPTNPTIQMCTHLQAGGTVVTYYILCELWIIWRSDKIVNYVLKEGVVQCLYFVLVGWIMFKLACCYNYWLGYNLSFKKTFPSPNYPKGYDEPHGFPFTPFTSFYINTYYRKQLLWC